NRRASSRAATALVTASLLAVAVGVAAARPAQAPPAALKGTLYDPTGAVLPGVALTLEDPQGGKADAVSNASGRFSFAGIGSGHYVLRAALPAFRSLRSEFDLTAVADWDRTYTLQVGELKETITVSE